MNKPIRAMAIMCLVLFVALLLNITYLQYVHARNDNKRVRDAEFSRKRGAILVGGTPIAESRPVKDQYKFQRVYPLARKYAQISGWYSYIYGRNAIELT